MKTLYLAENEEQVNRLLNIPGMNDNPLWIALSPFAIHALSSRNIAYKIPEDFYTAEEIDGVAVELPGKIKSLCNRLDAFAISQIEGLKSRKIKLYSDYSYPLHVVFESVFNKTFQLLSIFRQVKPEKVVCCGPTERYPFFWRGIGFDKREFLYADILAVCNFGQNIEFIETMDSCRYHKKAVRSGGIFISSRLKDILKRKLPLLYMVRKYGLRHLANMAKDFSKRQSTISLLGAGYEWDECEAKFYDSGYKFSRVDIKYEESGERTEDEFIGDKILNEIKDFMVFRRNDLTDILLPRLIFIYKEGSRRCMKAYDEAARHILRMRPTGLLYSTLVAPELRSAAWAFIRNDIPTFCKSHGIVGTFDQMVTTDNELCYANYYLANGEIAAEFYRNLTDRYPENNLKVVVTGSPKLERIKHGNGAVKKSDFKHWLKTQKASGRKMFLYITDFYRQNHSYFIFKPPPSDNILFKTQEEIIGFFKNKAGVSLIWKLHPNRLHDRPPLIEKHSDNIFTIQDELAFTDLLDSIDAVIMDSPATAFLQAATRTMPIFVITKHIQYTQEAIGLMEKRAVCGREPQELLKEVERYISTGHFGADMNDESFLKAYGTGHDIRDAVSATVNFVADAISNCEYARR